MSLRTASRAVVLAETSGVLLMGPAAIADQPPGQLGYEGQPASGLQGYEGQPGNQGH